MAANTQANKLTIQLKYNCYVIKKFQFENMIKTIKVIQE